MEKNWCVEVWGDLPMDTEVFYTKKEALQYFKSIRKGLDKTQYTFTKDSIVDKNNPDNAIYLTDLRELV